MFSTIDTEEQAYLLGWIASDGVISKQGSIALAIHKDDEILLKKMRDLVSSDIPITDKDINLKTFSINSLEIVSDVCRYLNIHPGKKSHTVQFPNLSTNDLKWAFLRGLFDGDGHVSKLDSVHNCPECNVASSSTDMRASIENFCGIPCTNSGNHLYWSGNNALDFLSRLYDNASISLDRKREAYIDWCAWVPGLSGKFGKELVFNWCKTDPNAIAPTKVHASDSGYDLTIIKKVKSYNNISLYGTGIKVQPEFGWYLDVVPRSSISKIGYMMVNSVGVIDRTYKGEILVALIKVDPDAKDLDDQLPLRIAQMIPRPIVHVQFVEIDDLGYSARGDGGYGSTGIK